MLGLFALTISSCKKDDDNKVDNEEDLKSTKMSYKVDGTQKTSTHLFAVKNGADAIGIYGAINDSEALVIGIDGFHGNGDYTTEEDDVIITYTSGKNATDVYVAEECTVKVTSSTNNEIKGTFTATVKNNANASKVVTEGKFEAKIVEAQD